MVYQPQLPSEYGYLVRTTSIEEGIRVGEVDAQFAIRGTKAPRENRWRK
jgi:hypothetical protein